MRATSRIAREYGIVGPSYTVSTACASATHAIGQAFWMVRNGVVDAAIAGGSEAPFSTGIPEGVGGHAYRRAGYLPSVFARS